MKLHWEIHALFFLVRNNSFDSSGKQKKVGAILLLVYYVFVSIGMAIFPEEISAKIVDTPGYELLSFENAGRGMVTLFAAQVANNWQNVVQIYMNLEQSAADAAAGKYYFMPLFFFVPLYLIVHLVVLNCLIAFVMEAYRRVKAIDHASRAGPHPLERRILNGFLRRRTEETKFLAVKRQITNWDVMREVCREEYEKFLRVHGLELPVPEALDLTKTLRVRGKTLRSRSLRSPPTSSERAFRTSDKSDAMEELSFSLNEVEMKGSTNENPLDEKRWADPSGDWDSAEEKPFLVYADYLSYYYVCRSQVIIPSGHTCFGEL